MATYYIGQVFNNEYPADCADWCNKQGNCHIEDVTGKAEQKKFQIIANAIPEPIDVNLLRMTPLDFINAIETLGVEYATIKALCDNNLEVEKQLRFCNHVYRGNPLLDELCGQFGITPEQLDELFRKYGE